MTWTKEQAQRFDWAVFVVKLEVARMQAMKIRKKQVRLVPDHDEKGGQGK